MYKEIKIAGLKPSDRVFKCQETLVKVRVLSKEILDNRKLIGPTALSIQISASICDKKGKALPDSEGRFAILPHTITLPLLDLGKNEMDFRNVLENALPPLIEKSVVWQKNRQAAKSALKGWTGQ